ncbi:uncharacterized protein LOC111519815 [Drosophila willistoni]|uniref:uncharacterized protein LOC111519815 n=1 Tax=Drosophila willistoni TaxID=7260 RepID=UPI000C26CEE2|nr:uncharacterized protein LOC111519815 [Drosophila willistoni]
MDQAILNLMLSNVDGCTEDSSLETNSIIDEFELLNTQCEGNCYQKLKSILQQAGKLIKLKDQQIDNHVKTISTLSMKCLEIHKDYMDQLKESMAPSNETNETLNSHETLRNQLVEQTKAREDQLNALLEESNKKVENLIAQLSETESKLKEANTFLQESNEKVKMLETEKQQMASKINEYEILIKNNETKIMNSEYKSIVYVTGRGDQMVTINNDIAGPGWIVIKRSERQRGSLKKTIDVDSSWVYSFIKDQPHELYIHLVYKDGTTSFAHYDDFALHVLNGSSVYKIKSMGALRSSLTIGGDYCGLALESISDTFTFVTCYTLMIRSKLKYQLLTPYITE